MHARTYTFGREEEQEEAEAERGWSERYDRKDKWNGHDKYGKSQIKTSVDNEAPKH